MFDFGVYVGPTIVIFGMLLALIGFAVWGSGAIRESADEAQLSLAAEGTANEKKSEAEITDISLPELSVISTDMEKTAEFSQPLDIVPTYSQSFLEGQELSPGGQAADYNAAIDRIKADLEASDSDESDIASHEDDEDANFDYIADDFAAIDIYGDAGYASDETINELVKLDSDIIEAANVVEALQGNHEKNQAEIVASSDSDDNVEEGLAVGNGLSDSDMAGDLPQNDEQQQSSIEHDLIEQSELEQAEMGQTAIEQTAMEETMILRYPKPDNTKISDSELLDATALEETRMHSDMPVSTEITDLGVGEAASVSAVDLAGLEDMSEEGILIPESPIAFGSRMAWLAIPGFKPSEVIALLRLEDVKSANWTMGLTQAYADNNQVFVSPSLGGWVLVIGKTLWQKADMNRSAENIPWLKDIGRRFGNVCFFSTMKGLGNHGWVGIRDGQIARAYGYSGELQELIWFVGEPTEEEEIINPAFVDETQEKYQPGFRPVIPDEKLVLAMAAAWSVDTSFKRRQYQPDFGFLGTMN